MASHRMPKTAAALTAMLVLAATASAAEPLRVVILSGANVHDWKATTPLLKQTYNGSSHFKVIETVNDVTQITAKTLADGDVIVSNWTCHPVMTGGPWTAEGKKALADAIRRGVGMVQFHAASAACNDWAEFQQISGLSWKWEHTSHTAYHTFKVVMNDPSHPITRDVPDFWITDELYQKMFKFTPTAFTTQMRAFAEGQFGGTGAWEPVLIATRLGKGRGVNFVLGHDVHAMRNIAWQTIMLRATQWAATGQVSVPIPEDWPTTAAAAQMVTMDRDAVLEAAATYRFGQPREPLASIEAWVTYVSSMPGARGVRARLELADRLTALLAPEVAPEFKAFVCRQLAVVGSKPHVPPVAGFLEDEQVADHARYALSRMTCPAARKALRDGLSNTEGNLLVGVIISTGDLRDADSVEALSKLLDNKDGQIAKAATMSLGRIGTAPAAEALRASRDKAPGNDAMKAVLVDALTTCAGRLQDDGDGRTAGSIWRDLYTANESIPVRMAAVKGLISCGVADRDELLIVAMSDPDPRSQTVAVQCLRDGFATRPDTAAAFVDWIEATINRTPDPGARQILVSQLVHEPSPVSLGTAVAWMKRDADLCEAAARTAATLGEQLAREYRAEVKAAMQAVLATSKIPDTITLADAALRNAARPVNLALGAVASSPDGLDPDGASGPDAAANDGNPQTYWDETDSQPLYRFKLAFPQPTQMSMIMIKGHAYHSYSPKDFDVLCDDKVVKAVSDAEYDEKTNETLVSFPRTTCSTLELKITGYFGGSPGIRELEVHDSDMGVDAAAYTPLPDGPPVYSWSKRDGLLALLNHGRVVWRFVYGKEAPKPFFHPLALIDGVQLTWASPPDHPWHRGLWFAWKELNNVNYWEEDATTHQSEGLTEVTAARVETADDFSAGISLDISYHQPGKPAVLTEKRALRVSRPDDKGDYFVDWEGAFTAGREDVLLEGGTAGGGYAGLSIRIAPETHDWRLIDSEGREDVPGSGPLAENIHGQRARWADFSMVDHASGQAAGLAFLEHAKTLRHPAQWHCVLEDEIPFGYFSPAPLWSEPYTLKAGRTFILSYRVLVHRERLSREAIEAAWRSLTGQGQ